MSFQPNPGDELFINGAAYTVGQHPAAPGLAYAQAGRQGIVYQLIPSDGDINGAKALKVFFPKFRLPAWFINPKICIILVEVRVCRSVVETCSLPKETES
ncbi:hypothetical protein [Paenibacillus pini]|uniref:hypothetical protein n=1 Tax=Paenibacillus pini TaxID=669461 RepID=UPI000ABA862C